MKGQRCASCDRVLQGQSTRCLWCGHEIGKPPLRADERGGHTEALWTALRQGSESKAAAAVDQLLDTKGDKVVPKLLEVLRDDDRQPVRIRILDQLLSRELKTQDEMCEILGRVLANQYEVSGLKRCLRLLVRIGDSRVDDILISTALAERADRNVAIECVKHLIERAGNSAAAATRLARIVVHGPSPLAIRALTFLTRQFKDRRQLGTKALQAIIRAPREQARFRVLELIQEYPEPGKDAEFWMPWLEMLAGDESPGIRQHVLQALARLETARSVELLIRFLSDDCAEVRQKASDVLAELPEGAVDSQLESPSSAPGELLQSVIKRRRVARQARGQQMAGKSRSRLSSLEIVLSGLKGNATTEHKLSLISVGASNIRTLESAWGFETDAIDAVLQFWVAGVDVLHTVHGEELQRLNQAMHDAVVNGLVRFSRDQPDLLLKAIEPYSDWKYFAGMYSLVADALKAIGTSDADDVRLDLVRSELQPGGWSVGGNQEIVLHLLAREHRGVSEFLVEQLRVSDSEFSPWFFGEWIGQAGKHLLPDQLDVLVENLRRHCDKSLTNESGVTAFKTLIRVCGKRLSVKTLNRLANLSDAEYSYSAEVATDFFEERQEVVSYAEVRGWAKRRLMETR